MIVYQAKKDAFIKDVEADRIDSKILRSFRQRLGRNTSPAEVNSWAQSMQYMFKVLIDPEIPGSCGVAIEYQLPLASKRVDFILSGLGRDRSERMILIELKQWSTAEYSAKDAVVITHFGRAAREVAHPSYQAWSYASLLENFNETVSEAPIYLSPCAYLHNYMPDDVMMHPHYHEHINRAPVFLKGDVEKLRAFIKEFVRYGDDRRILYRIDHGRIRPSRMLADALSSMLRGNREFVMIDEQKVVFETALSLAEDDQDGKKVLIVRGGPGTGKSVVAIHLLVQLTELGKTVSYVSKNAAPRAVYEKMLTGTLRKTAISNLFMGSGSFCETPEGVFDVLIVDEAHRLNERSGLFANKGENQVKELIHAADTSIFFIDEDQRVTLKDIGTASEIRKWAGLADASVEILELPSQFRCNGSDGYLAWLDRVLGIRETANRTLDEINYDFRVFSSPVELREVIREKNLGRNKSRMVAGYCWEWRSKRNPLVDDVMLPEYDFSMKWNMESKMGPWILREDAVEEIGCIHTCQGLDLEYIGVIIGPDLTYREGRLVTDPSKRARSDKSVFGYRKCLREKPEEGARTLEMIIKNTYRALMTRGMKGCYVYCVDAELAAYLQSSLYR